MSTWSTFSLLMLLLSVFERIKYHGNGFGPKFHMDIFVVVAETMVAAMAAHASLRIDCKIVTDVT